MRTIRDTLLGEEIRFHLVESVQDLRVVAAFITKYRLAGEHLGLDTESNHFNCYRKGWFLKTWQVSDSYDSYIVPAKYRKFLSWAMSRKGTKWVGHNLPHDIRSIDRWLGYDTGVRGDDTYIPAHHNDSRGRDEGGTGHKLEDLAFAFISRECKKWEKERKAAFKKIKVPSGQVYKTSKRAPDGSWLYQKGDPRLRIIREQEGWELIDIAHPAMIAYAGADPIMTHRLWRHYRHVVRANRELYEFDLEVQEGYDELQRRAMAIDVPYTERLSAAYARRAKKLRGVAARYGCDNIQSGPQIADTLGQLGVKLRAKTDSGQYKTDAELLRKILARDTTPDPAKEFIRAVLGAKQCEKRRSSYTESMLAEMDENGRVHPSIRSLAARTTRSSVSGPPLQQLPTQDHEDEEG